jgi:hypothetical protein
MVLAMPDSRLIKASVLPMARRTIFISAATKNCAWPARASTCYAKSRRGRRPTMAATSTGSAGTGKSTIARTVARHFAARQQLGAGFFFQRGGGDLASGRLFVTTIAVQLAEHVPSLKKHVAAAVRATHNVSARTLQDRWRRLVMEPLAKIGMGDFLPRLLRKPLVIIVNALDKCNSDSDIGDVLGLISSAESSRLRTSLTCRTETPIQYCILSINWGSRHVLALRHIDSHVVHHDIYAYLASKVHHVGREYYGDFC